MEARDEINKLLKKYSAELVRDKKHLVYRFPNGKQLVMAKTPSDTRAYDNCLSNLKRLLGIVHQPVIGQRKERRYYKSSRRKISITASGSVALPDWRAQLQQIAPTIVWPWWKRWYLATRKWLKGSRILKLPLKWFVN